MSAATQLHKQMKMATGTGLTRDIKRQVVMLSFDDHLIRAAEIAEEISVMYRNSSLTVAAAC